MGRLLRHIEKEWTKLAEERPFHAVLTQDKYTGKRLDRETYGKFYQSGSEEIEEIAKRLASMGERLPHGRCLEYGCGVGRNLVHFSGMFDSVTGVDISTPMLEVARRELDARNLVNVDLRRIASFRDIDKLGKYDFIFSVIVLQHNPPPVMAFILDGLFKSLAPGGIIFFQIPLPKKSFRFKIGEYLDYAESRKSTDAGKTEMFGLPQYKIFELARKK